MKIVHVIGYFQPEFGYKEYYIARNQVKQGHEVYVITSDRVAPFEQYGEIADKLAIPKTRRRPLGKSTIDGITVFRLPVLFEFRIMVLVIGVKRLLRRINPDVVFSYDHVQLSTVLPGLWKKKLGYFWIADHQLYEIPRTILGKAYFYLFSKYLYRYMLRSADYNIFSRAATEQFAQKTIGYSKDNYTTVTLGVDTDFFRYDQGSRGKIRSRYGIEENDFVIINTGKIDPIKHTESLFRIVKDLKEKNVANIKLMIIGTASTQHQDFLNNEVKKNQISAEVIFTGFIDRSRLYEFYSASDVGIWPYRPSIAIVEAIGCSLPVIIPDSDAVKHYVQYGNGLLFKDGDLNELSWVVTQLVQDSSKLRSLREKARAATEQHFDYAKITKRILDTALASRNL